MEIKTVQEQKTLYIRTTTPVAQLPAIMGPAYGKLAAYAGENGAAFAGPPYARYYNMDMDALDVEIGFPVDKVLPGQGDIQAGTLPGGKRAAAVHRGPYTTIGATYDKLMAYTQQEGLTTTEWMYESYLNSPEENPPEKLETEIFFPILEDK